MLKIACPMFLFNAHYMAHCAYKNLLSLVNPNAEVLSYHSKGKLL